MQVNARSAAKNRFIKKRSFLFHEPRGLIPFYLYRREKGRFGSARKQKNRAELLKRSSALLYAVKNMARMEVMMPQTHRAMELMAP